VLRREFAGLTPDPDVVGFDGRQAEFSKPIGDYVRAAVSDARLATARKRLAGLPDLPKIVQTYGVPGEVLVAIWAMESGFGAIQGNKDVARSLASLASAGRRRSWAESQLDDVIRIIASGKAARDQLKGSWAGAMGQTQMEPSEYLHYAVDGDGDGRADIWGSAEDALASAAHLLAHDGWRRGPASIMAWPRGRVRPPSTGRRSARAGRTAGTGAAGSRCCRRSWCCPRARRAPPS
jgi:lytic murein transglycosylase